MQTISVGHAGQLPIAAVGTQIVAEWRECKETGHAVSSLRAVVVFGVVGAGTVVAVGVAQRLIGFATVILAALFISFALEPLVSFLERRGIGRGRATKLVFAALGLLIVGFLYGIWSVLRGEAIKLGHRWPSIVSSLSDQAHKRFGTSLDPSAILTNDTVATRLATAIGDVGKVAWTTLSGVFTLVAIVILTYFLTADGPRLRRTLCSQLSPTRQRHVLHIWETAIDRTGRYIYSRFILGIVSAIGHTIAFTVIGVPYPIALGVWVGVASQAVPLVGTYLAGLLPALVALASSPSQALAVVVFVTVFQQIENHTLGPVLSRRAVEIHPAVAFGAVIVGTTLLGAIGAVLAVPTVAIVTSLVRGAGGPTESAMRERS